MGHNIHIPIKLHQFLIGRLFHLLCIHMHR